MSYRLNGKKDGNRGINVLRGHLRLVPCMCLLKWFVPNILMISELLGCAGNRFIEFMFSLLLGDYT